MLLIVLAVMGDEHLHGQVREAVDAGDFAWDLRHLRQ